nr:phosphoadenylyl-sulfate reductase [Bacteroidales bacterium]
NHIKKYKSEGKTLFTTSSFQSHSIVLLHILSRIDKTIPVYFINTGYHFPETINFKEHISDLLGLNVKDTIPVISKHLQKDSKGSMLFATNPDYCCYINKIQPVEPLLQRYDIWINGVRADQNENRRQFKTELKTAFHSLRFHPIIDWTSKMIYDYLKEYKLPRHPLEAKGYFSIGCEPCTRATNGIDIRDARWFGLNKTECGLNTDLIKK